MSPSRRILLSTLGTLGDLHPYLAIGLGLKERGFDVVVATSPAYQARVESVGLEFSPMRPDRPPFEKDPNLGHYYMDQKKGSERIIRNLLMPNLKESYEDLRAPAKKADLIITHSLSFSGRLVAEKLEIPWISTVIAPLSFFSCFDPPVLAPAPYLSFLRPLGPKFHQKLFHHVREAARSWAEPWHQLRKELGLPAAEDPIFEGQHSPRQVLALFSRLLAHEQPDWPAKTKITGFAFYAKDAAGPLSPALHRFIDGASPFLVFTLGSSAVYDSGDFYRESAEAAKKLGMRALLVGATPRDTLLSREILSVAYAPFSKIFPRAAAIIHQGGVGTLGWAMASGRPMLIVPHAHDQLDNAQRAVRLRIARSLHRDKYTASAVARELRKLTQNPAHALAGAAVARLMASEHSISECCDAIASSC